MSEHITKEIVITNIIKDHLAVDLSQVVHDAHIIDDLGGDSLDIIELTMAFEEEFEITISDDETDEHITTVNSCMALISNKLEEKIG